MRTLPCRRAPAAALVLGAAVVAAPAFAQDRPANLQPTRDVAIAYRVGGASGEGTMRIAFSAAAQAIRTDFTGFGPPGPVIADISGRRMILLLEAERTAIVQPIDEAEARSFREPDPGTRFTRQGTDRVAGTACTTWRVEPPPEIARAGARPVTTCLTEDGVMLRSEEGGQRAEATQVTYAPQDPARFRVPDGWRTRQE
jgi:hypothetical protein